MDLHIFAFILLVIFTIEIVFVFIMGASKIRGKPDLTFPGPPPSIFPRPPPMPRPFPNPGFGRPPPFPPGPWPMPPGRPGNRPIHRPGHGGPGHGGPGHGGTMHDLESVTFYLKGKDDFEKTLDVKNKTEFNVDFSELLNDKYEDDSLMLKYKPRNTNIKWSLGSLSGEDNRSPVDIGKVEDLIKELDGNNNLIFKLTNKVR